MVIAQNPKTVLRLSVEAVYACLQGGAMLRAEAIAFLMFLSFFPALLFLVGALTLLLPGWEVLLEHFREMLPPGSRRSVLESLLQVSGHPGKLLLTGSIGTLVIGSQLMSGLKRVFSAIHGCEMPKGFWREQLHACGMVMVTVIPWVAVSVLLVFGRSLRHWVVRERGFDFPAGLEFIWTLGYFALIFLTATLVLAALYHNLTPERSRPWHDVLPGAALAMLLWWIVTTGFAFYVHHIALYSVLYGGFAGTIGLLLWMFLSALVTLMGAEFNARLHALTDGVKSGEKAG